MDLVSHREDSELHSQCNRKKLEGFQQKKVMSDLHLKEITLAALWRKVCKGQQRAKGKGSVRS